MTDAEQDELRRNRLLAFIAADVRASEAAVFVPRGEGLVFVAQHRLRSDSLEVAEWFWKRRRETLENGECARNAAAVAWPLFNGPKLVAFIYLVGAQQELPTPDNKRDGQRIVEWLPAPQTLRAPALYTAGGRVPATASEFQADRVTLALETHHGNVTAAARMLGVTRQTVYNRHPGGADGVREQRDRLRQGKKK